MLSKILEKVVFYLLAPILGPWYMLTMKVPEYDPDLDEFHQMQRKVFTENLVQNTRKCVRVWPEQHLLQIIARVGFFPEVYRSIAGDILVPYGPYNDRQNVEVSCDGNGGLFIKWLEPPSGLIRISTERGVTEELDVGGPKISCDGFGKFGTA